MFAYSDKTASKVDVNYRNVYGGYCIYALLIICIYIAATTSQEKLHRTWQHRRRVSPIHTEADRRTAIRYQCVAIHTYIHNVIESV